MNTATVKNKKMWYAMQEHALSVVDLAKASQVSRNAIYRALNCEPVRPGSIRRLCAALQKTPLSIGLADQPVQELRDVM